MLFQLLKQCQLRGAAAKDRGRILASHPAPPGSILGGPRIFLLMLLRFINGTAKNSRQRLDNVNQTHLVLAIGKLVQQKRSIENPNPLCILTYFIAMSNLFHSYLIPSIDRQAFKKCHRMDFNV